MRICLQRRATERSDEFASAWPLVARAQQGVRRIGVLVPLDENDPPAKSLVSAFTQALADLGWTDGSNLRIDLRQLGDEINRIPALAGFAHYEWLELLSEIVPGLKRATILFNPDTARVLVFYAEVKRRGGVHHACPETNAVGAPVRAASLSCSLPRAVA